MDWYIVYVYKFFLYKLHLKKKIKLCKRRFFMCICETLTRQPKITMDINMRIVLLVYTIYVEAVQ